MQKPKKILVDLTNWGNLTAGFGQIANNYAQRFASINDESIHFVYLMPRGTQENFGKPVTCVPIKKTLNKLFPCTLPSVDIWHAVNQQRKLLRKRKGTKFIFTIHDFNFLTEKSPWKAKIYLKRMQRKIDAASVVTTISQYTADVIQQYVNIGNKPLRVIYNGVERIDTLPDKKPAFANERPFFFTIGQIRRKKNFHLLVEVMKSFPKYDLFICGDDHFEYANEIRNLMHTLKTDNVFLTGPIKQEEKIWLYRNCQAFLFPSEGEGFGLPVIEAMQFGKAVFAANRTSLPEICGDYAFMWDNLNPQAMAEIMKEHLPDFYQNQKRIEAIKAHAHSFSYEKHIEAYYQLYKELLSEE